MSDLPGPSRKSIRTSQREVKSCGFCYRRKLKCNKVYPCQRCIARGLGELCQQETVLVNGRIIGGDSARTSRRQPTIAQLTEENKTLHRKVSAQEKVIRSLLDQSDGTSVKESNSAQGQQLVPRRESLDLESAKSESESRGPSSRASTAEAEAGAAELEERTEYLHTVGQLFGLSATDIVGRQEPSKLFGQSGVYTLEALCSLVPLDQSTALVRYHCNFIHWIHTVFHVPTYLREHDEWLSGIKSGLGEVGTYDYYALYFAVIACSLYFMDDKVANAMGFAQDAILVLPRFWFDISLQCLQLSGFMTSPSIPILQTICILPTIAHAFDGSKYLASLMHCGLGLARDLKFHLVRSEGPSALWGGYVRSEIARRIWWCLMIADSLKPGAQHPFHLIYPAAWTSPPSNIDDSALSDDSPPIPRPLNEVTCVSHLLLMGRLADLFRDFSHTFTSKSSASSRFRIVKTFAERLDKLFDAFPNLRPREDEVYPEQYDPFAPFDWQCWSRYLWATAIPTLRIELWRWFLGRSYTDERFAEARQICVASARAQIAARKKRVPIMFQKNWHVSSYTVVAGMVLATELIHGKPDETERFGLHAEIIEIVNFLRSMENPDAMVKRGVQILDKLLAEAYAVETASATASLSNPMIPQTNNNFTGSDLGAAPIWPLADGPSDFDSDLFDMLLSADAWAPPSSVE
ncbi:hypothetical protein BCR39DRAFT_596085 [Naematelia encephala]|uniref:Zn(2)-C6 fungal-type domain-containing protein n=1 Tax=Naematelia encephala TaxID=71784 RepID=A0A1Y2BL49_9TREE|nr:hypothetical protein BCR39DRAFT_596085 [Naematelia encephala]